MNALGSIAQVGDLIEFAEERRAYTVRAASGRYLICTKPFSLPKKRTVLYTVVDLAECVRGTENLIFSMGAETDEQCAAMLRRLHGMDADSEQTEVSYRNRIALNIVEVRKPAPKA